MQVGSDDGVTRAAQRCDEMLTEDHLSNSNRNALFSSRRLGARVERPKSSFVPWLFRQPSANEKPLLSHAIVKKSSTFQFRMSNSTPLPPQIRQEVAPDFSDCILGIFPEIHRSFVAKDSKLFIWNFRKTPNNLVVWSPPAETESEQIILSVCLANPRVDVGLDTDVPYVLVVATTLMIHILAIRVAGDSIDSPVSLHDTPFSAHVGGALLTALCPIPNGKVIAGSTDGEIFVIDYYPGWLRRTSVKVRRISSWPLTLALIFAPWFKNKVLDIAVSQVSKEKVLVFVLYEDGSISVFDSPDSSLTSLSERCKDSVSFSSAMSDEASRPIRIFGINGWESESANLCVVNALGQKYFFAFDASLNFLTLLDHKEFWQQRDPTQKTPLISRVVEHAYSKGEFSLLSLGSRLNERNGNDELFCIVLDQVSQFAVPGVILDVVEDTVAFEDSEWASITYARRGCVPLEGLSSMSIQHLLPRKRFYILTNNGVKEVTVDYPLDKLIALLSAPSLDQQSITVSSLSCIF